MNGGGGLDLFYFFFERTYFSENLFLSSINSGCASGIARSIDKGTFGLFVLQIQTVGYDYLFPHLFDFFMKIVFKIFVSLHLLFDKGIYFSSYS